MELLAPAGDLEKLKIAVDYGADAVYFGGEMFSLRAGAGNICPWPGVGRRVPNMPMSMA